MLTLHAQSHGRFCDGVSRRDFLRVGGLALGGLTLPQMLRAEAQSGVTRSHKAVIMVFLPGGPSHQDIFDLKMDAPSEIRGEFRPIATNVPGIQITEHLPRLARMMDKCTLIRSMSDCEPQHDAFQCLTGRSLKQQPLGGWPSFGATVSKLRGAIDPAVPPFVGLAPKMGHMEWARCGEPGFLGVAHAPFQPNKGSGVEDMTLNGVTLDRLADRRALLDGFDRFRRDVDASGLMDGLDAFNQQAFGVLTSSRLLHALDVRKEDPRIAARYGKGDPKNRDDGGPKLMEHFLAARRLVEAGARCVTVAFSRWDHHGKNFDALRQDLPLLDQGLTALIADLHERGLEKDVSVVVWGEFGRTPTINKDAGRDHWPRVSCALLAGGGMRHGQVIGATDRLGGEATGRPVRFGEVFATLYQRLGIDVTKTTIDDLTGRPQYLVQPGCLPMAELDLMRFTLATAVALLAQAAVHAQPVNFTNDIVPIFTKAGCNSGGCHGKAGGQNGFRLSLLGFEPGEDYEHIVKEARGRRVFPAAPENSLLLLKGLAAMPHGGGRRLDPGSEDYATLVRWIAEGMPFGRDSDPKIAGIEVIPAQRTMALDGEQQLAVLAHYTDGSKRDVTRSALYEANEKSMAEAGETGRVKLLDQPGDVAIMVRYQGRVATFRATVPLGAAVDNLPPARNYIDEHVFAKLRAMGLPPSEPCDDATFIRRVSIDVAGRLPSLDETTRFLADTDPAKRDRLIDTLLASPEYADYFAGKWSALLRNKRTKPSEAPATFAFHGWLRDSLRANRPYDEIVRDILTATGGIAENPPAAWYRQVKDPQQQLEDTAQLFLGVRMQCAQCHHHPFEKWSQNDYYSFSAFFTQMGRKAAGTVKDNEVIFHRRGVATAVNKKTKLPVKPAALTTGPLDIPPDDDPRIALADWMGDRANPFFARALVNRYWKHFFSRGIVEPEDDMRETNPPSNPGLLDALARRFIAGGCDLKALVRDITRSRTYQLSAVPNNCNKADRQNFSRYYARRLTAEVLFDSLNEVTRTPGSFAGMPGGTRAVALPDNSFNAGSYFLTVFGRPESSSACECERTQEASLAQALHLLNAKDIQEKLASDNGAAARLAADPRSDDEKLRELYLTAYARPPEPGELALAKAHLGKPRKSADGVPLDAAGAKRQGCEDIVWAILNTKEFLFNH